MKLKFYDEDEDREILYEVEERKGKIMTLVFPDLSQEMIEWIEGMAIGVFHCETYLGGCISSHEIFMSLSGLEDQFGEAPDVLRKVVEVAVKEGFLYVHILRAEEAGDDRFKQLD